MVTVTMPASIIPENLATIIAAGRKAAAEGAEIIARAIAFYELQSEDPDGSLMARWQTAQLPVRDPASERYEPQVRELLQFALESEDHERVVAAALGLVKMLGRFREQGYCPYKPVTKPATKGRGGRPTIGKQAMTTAERSRRYRAAKRARTTPAATVDDRVNLFFREAWPFIMDYRRRIEEAHAEQPFTGEALETMQNNLHQMGIEFTLAAQDLDSNHGG